MNRHTGITADPFLQDREVRVLRHALADLLRSLTNNNGTPTGNLTAYQVVAVHAAALALVKETPEKAWPYTAPYADGGPHGHH